jgi:prolyl-tRNA synthetase
MVHGDDQGLVMPPRLAPHQIVIVPIFKNDEEKSQTIEAARKLKAELLAAGFRVITDEREGQSPGFKFNDWEMRGVPLRIELGPKDLAKQSVMLARRDRPGREGKSPAAMVGIVDVVGKLLTEIQAALYQKALAFREAHTADAKTYDELKSAVETGFALSHWCGSVECEGKIKEETKATMRCIPLGQEAGEGICVYCGKPAKEKGIFGRAY